ncbi:MAG: CoA ester lyase [Burkholderiales bacterium]|nr:CoA ester lyase [Burkholderiales bacterium]
MSPLVLARTYLFVPGDRPERFAKALASGADAVVLDLEDAVAPAAKEAARAAVAQSVAQAVAAQRTDAGRFVVRINSEETPWFEADLRALAGAGAQAVMLPKAERAETVMRVCAAGPGIAVLALVESARGVLAAEALAAAPGVVRLVFGALDYALDLDLEVSATSSFGQAGLDAAASRIAIASRAAGLPAPVAGVTTVLNDEAALLADWARARAHGFGAKLCIHPKQVAPIHAALAPSAAELAWAERVLAAAEAAAGAAVQLDGRMVDRPVIERARRLRERAAR